LVANQKILRRFAAGLGCILLRGNLLCCDLLLGDDLVGCRLLLLRELQIRCACTDQHRDAAECLTDGFAEVVRGIGAGFRIVDLDVQPVHLRPW
jgi:hypothetical protein